jgi:hypothetical protein
MVASGHHAIAILGLGASGGCVTAYVLRFSTWHG